VNKLELSTFKRVEKKYILSLDQRDKLIQELGPYMNKDSYCEKNKFYLIRNIYFDTPNRDLIHISVQKPNYKEKIRIRRYGSYENEPDHSFLEIKRKCNKIVSKRRVKIEDDELEPLLKNNIFPKKNKYLPNQVLKEIQYIFSMYNLEPKIFLSYERIAFFSKEDSNFRLTFDNNIQYRRTDLSFDYKENNVKLLNDDTIIMEIKINGAITLWFTKILDKLKIYPHSFSKYGTEYKQLLKEDELQCLNQYCLTQV
jgi:hypothetical protein